MAGQQPRFPSIPASRIFRTARRGAPRFAANASRVLIFGWLVAGPFAMRALGVVSVVSKPQICVSRNGEAAEDAPDLSGVAHELSLPLD
jgi:hypothetical protein